MTYKLTQQSEVIDVEPLSTGETIEDFYGWGRYNHPHSHTSTGIERTDVSGLFLWDGPEGISLVFLHDRRDDSGGGRITFEFDGLPDDGEWAVRDDDPGNDTYYGNSKVDWYWGGAHTDGGAYRGVADSQVTITPHFYSGIQRWQLLSGDAENPERHDLEMGEPVTITPQLETNASGSATTVSWVPGLSENDDAGGNDLWSAFPDEGPLPGLPIDEAFLGDKTKSMGETVEETLEMRKSVQGLDGEHGQYRVKNTVEVTFRTDGQSVYTDEESTLEDSDIRVDVNTRLPDEVEFESYVDGESPDVEVGLLDASDPEPLPKTVVEENIEEDVNASLVDAVFDERTKVVHDRKRYLTVTLDEYSFRGKTLEGVRVATLWGAENPYTHEISMSDVPVLNWLPGSNPIIYTWIDLIVLADGTHAVRVQDATQFPMHTLYTGPSNRPADQRRRTDSGLEIIYDTDATTENEYKAAINEDNHKPWGQFFGSFDDNTTYVPYRTPKKRYVKNHNNDSTGRWIGYKNELLVDHPIMVFGESGDGNTLTEDQVTELLDSPQVPFPGLL